MALAQPTLDGSRFTWGRFGRTLLKLAISPWCLAYFACALTSPYWIPYAIYGLLRSSLAAGGLWIWLWLVLAAGTALWGVGSFFGSIFVRLGPSFKSLPPEEQAQRRTAARAESRARVAKRTWRLWGGMIALQLAIPAVVALVLLSWFQEPTYIRVVNGKRVYATPRQSLETYLRGMERHGISFWFRSQE